MARVLKSPDDRVVVKSIVDLAAALGIRSVAEGVESADVAAALLDMGCVAAQGWYFAKPMNAVSATAWLLEHSAGRRRGKSATRPLAAGLDGTRPTVAVPAIDGDHGKSGGAGSDAMGSGGMSSDGMGSDSMSSDDHGDPADGYARGKRPSVASPPLGWRR